ncbi:MAG: M61 family metallopeptidase [Gemmatimonadota bacterium]|nr:MAG: M61 family metallopeptidase [Gemmatimonadota bacterium]
MRPQHPRLSAGRCSRWIVLVTILAPRPGLAQQSLQTIDAPLPHAHQAGDPTVENIRYTVTFDERTATHRSLHVDMTFDVSEDGPVILSLPAWTPGSYELDHFARHVRGFQAESDGNAVRWDKADYDSWRLHPEHARTVTVSFDYRADTLDTGMSWSADDFAYFNGANLFLYPEGQGYDFPVDVTIRTEPGWGVSTGLEPAANPGDYSARDYHEAVDMPTFIGRFDLDSARIDGRWYRLASYPEGVLAGDERSTVWQQVRDIMPPLQAVFGETPFDRYTILMVFPDEYPGGAALEHSNSHLGIYTRQLIGNPILASVLAHEIFHAWNVKRLRPAELTPYEYDRPQLTTLLWVSEGITDYYADLALVRGGVVQPEGFYHLTANKISTVRRAPPVALEDASLSTWIEPDDGTAFLYYPKGSLVGLMLDILIRHRSGNRASLDDVMRSLYEATFLRGQGFTEDQWWAAVLEAAGGDPVIDVQRLSASYIDGREPYPWETVLPLAGLALVADTARYPQIGFRVEPDARGVRVVGLDDDGRAAAAGVRSGDYLLRVGEIEVRDAASLSGFRQRYGREAAGSPVEIDVRRGDEVITLSVPLDHSESVRYSIVEQADAAEGARRIREGILTGRTSSGMP